MRYCLSLDWDTIELKASNYVQDDVPTPAYRSMLVGLRCFRVKLGGARTRTPSRSLAVLHGRSDTVSFLCPLRTPKSPTAARYTLPTYCKDPESIQEYGLAVALWQLPAGPSQRMSCRFTPYNFQLVTKCRCMTYLHAEVYTVLYYSYVRIPPLKKKRIQDITVLFRPVLYFNSKFQLSFFVSTLFKLLSDIYFFKKFHIEIV